MNAPIIVAAILAPADLAWADGLRRAHFPPERNRLPAHLTLFHHLPPSAGDELARRLRVIAAAPRPAAEVDRVRKLGGGVALDVRTPDLVAMRAALADGFAGQLTPQDAAGWRPHITIQNKVTAAAAAALHAALSRDFRPRPIGIAGIATHHYVEGDWQPIARFMFRGWRRPSRASRGRPW